MAELVAVGRFSIRVHTNNLQFVYVAPHPHRSNNDVYGLKTATTRTIINGVPTIAPAATLFKQWKRSHENASD